MKNNSYNTINDSLINQKHSPNYRCYFQVRQLVDFTPQQSNYLKQALSCRCHQKIEVDNDQRLAQWLQGLDLQESSKELLNEGYTLDEVLYEIDREDLHRVGLQGGPELRIWRAIIQHRQNTSNLCNGDMGDVTGTV